MSWAAKFESCCIGNIKSYAFFIPLNRSTRSFLLLQDRVSANNAYSKKIYLLLLLFDQNFFTVISKGEQVQLSPIRLVPFPHQE